ncbi:diguanylate cyclase [Neptuniibacter marinus]|uniref:sensor domain-containing diguanylate cyclase n=1 Tax=Neptuniibacter marinus TaxID=1806670 RepID=UPI003B5C124F
MDSKVRSISHSAESALNDQSSTQTNLFVCDQVDPSLLVQVFDRIALPTFVLDTNHVVLHWNSALEKLSGLCREDMIGTKNHWKPFYSTPRPCLADLILNGGRYEDVEYYYTNKCKRSELIDEAYEAEDFFPECGADGEWLHFTAAGIMDPEGNLIGAIETLENISARKIAELELLERERTYKELSVTDSLTGLYNNRHFYTKLEVNLDEARRYRHEFTLCFFDLDDFKKLNDAYGHLMGDMVLETFGSLIQSSLRGLDSGYRYGGEEFAVLLPSTDTEGALKVANRIRESLESYQFMLPDDGNLHVSVSIGLTAYTVGDSVQSIMTRADEGLYKAKSQGRNCIITV